MRCHRRNLSVVVHTMQVILLHVHFTTCALPASFQDGDNNLHRDTGHEGQRGSGRDTSSSRITTSSSRSEPSPRQQLHSVHKPHWNHDTPDPSTRFNSRQNRWASAAFSFVHSLNCEDVFFTTSRECQALVSVPRHDMNVYVASPSPYGKYRTTIPEEPLTGSGLHEAVVVVDPYPRANFGHLVVVFFVDSRVSRGHCQKMGGVYLDEDECMYLALRRRCRNALERLSRRRNYARRCEINFLPVVHLATRRGSDHLASHPHQRHSSLSSSSSSSIASSTGNNPLHHTNHLECKSELAGFAKCPELRPANETEGVLCNHLRDNTRRCSTTHESVRTSCRMFEVCDQAVLISGGWNRHASGPRHLDNVKRMYGMLRHNGFKRRNIKVFFANGAQSLQVGRDPPHKVYPAAMKLALRNHIRRLCLTPHCVDSLFLYLNSPARSDGSALLWDVDADGLAEEGERYTVRELREDLADCSARQVTLVVDQSFSGELVHELRHSPAHRNLLVFSSGKSGEYSFDDEFTRFWASRNHTRSCSTEIHAASRAAVQRSNPRMGEGEEGRIRTTIFGAPCDVRPPFTTRELRQNYFGCQNLPTAVWLREILRASDTGFLDNTDRNDDDDDDDDDDDEFK